MRKLLVIGAAGDVGQGIVEIALSKGWSVVAAGRNEARLKAVATRLGSPAALQLVAGDICDESSAATLLERSLAALGAIESVVVSVNAAQVNRPLIEWTSGELLGILQANLISHFVAAKTFIPTILRGGTYVAIGGGTADFIIPGLGQLSMAQAAQRMMIRAMAKEHGAVGTHVRELIIQSMVNGKSTRETASPAWLTDLEIGQHVTEIIADPMRFSGPILSLQSKDQAGKP